MQPVENAQENLGVPLKPANVDGILGRLQARFPDPRCELEFQNPFELLVATILSAQCTDRQVNKVLPQVRARWPGAADLARAPVEDVEQVIRPTGLFRAKARNLTAMAVLLEERHQGAVPASMEALVSLPGVARKTANVVLGTAFGLAQGIVVDTHMVRVTRRWGWHDTRDPSRVERRLLEIVPRERWIDFGHQGVLFGRYQCLAQRPRCATCDLADLCPSRS